nr:hypothetical protein [Tanacetum cinerariifolium]
MECLYIDEDDSIFTLVEPLEEMGSKAIEVLALKEDEFAQLTVLGVYVSFPNGKSLSFALMQVSTVFLIRIHLRPTQVKILPVGFHDLIFGLIALKLWSANIRFVIYSCRGRHARVSIPDSLSFLRCLR